MYSAEVTSWLHWLDQDIADSGARSKREGANFKNEMKSPIPIPVPHFRSSEIIDTFTMLMKQLLA